MSEVVFQELVDDRADVLAGKNLNGMKLVLVALPPGADPDHADLDLRFFNELHVAAILAEITATPARAGQIFRVRGGTRVPAGAAAGQVKVTAVAGVDATRLSLRVLRRSPARSSPASAACRCGGCRRARARRRAPRRSPVVRPWRQLRRRP